MVTSFSQFTLIKVKKIFRKSQPQFWEKLRELRLRRNSSLLIKKTCIREPCLFSASVSPFRLWICRF